jgi:NitT/TauT family transport system ATP-binding protein
MLEVKQLGKTYGEGAGATQAIGKLTFGIAEKEFVCVVGPSGCGKTTLLKCMSGLLEPSAGAVELNGARVTRPPEEMALVFQEYSRSLLPWLSVRGNVTLPLRHKRLDKPERTRLVEDAVDAVALTRFIDHYPWELSGGMQQRTAICRALVHDPSLLLMDEPFGALDAMTREEMSFELLRIWGERRKTILFVTHSISEAILLSDRVVVMTPRPGRLARVLEIDLPRPRTVEMEFDERFKKASEEIRSLIFARRPEAADAGRH